MLNKVIDVLKMKSLVIPQILFNNYRLLNITDSELIVLIYIINEEANFNPRFMAKQLNFEYKELMELISNLTDKGLIKIDSDPKNKEEKINLDLLYDKLSFIIIDDKAEIDSNIYSIVEKEFGRTLSPVEYEIIRNWLTDFNDKMINLALKESIFNGVFNLRYIDTILHEWQKKGIKNEQDIVNDRNKYKDKKPVKKVMDYDWLNEKNN